MGDVVAARAATATPWCAKGRWHARVRAHHAGETTRAVVCAMSVDGMLMAGDIDLKSGQVVEVEIDLNDDHTAVVTAQVRRASGAAFLRFAGLPDRSWRQERLLKAVGRPTARGAGPAARDGIPAVA